MGPLEKVGDGSCYDRSWRVFDRACTYCQSTPIALSFNIGGINVNHAEAAMRLTAKKVMPHV